MGRGLVERMAGPEMQINPHNPIYQTVPVAPIKGMLRPCWPQAETFSHLNTCPGPDKIDMENLNVFSTHVLMGTAFNNVPGS